MIKAKVWKGNALAGSWDVTLKIDGVRALRKDGAWVSRKGKPLYNIPDHVRDDVEVFLGSFKETIEATRTKNEKKLIEEHHLYPLSDPIDPRLFVSMLHDPVAAEIETLRNKYIALGYEGLVLRHGDTWLKVKNEETHDVSITGYVVGKGKHRGKLGAILTPLGKVGTGFSDEERDYIWKHQEKLLNETIEVSCMQLTVENKFRHPRFVRFRPDK